ncbi:hypothetical protein KIW84_052690 [Lathyrus oleraceus]|uniref:DUF7769 domain-containing protein n=1 Tax=Pisum sativum TaxID=3888 RepID=A0A9D5AFK8_PEA|nr:hypothetical protein KIW84_052690 [Pisum sativum]
MADENESVISESSKKRGFLNNEDRKAICQILLCSSDANGNLIGTGVVERVAASYNVHRSVIYRIWKQLKDTGNVCHNRTQNCGRKRVQLDLELMRQVPLSKRSTYRSLACALNIPKTSLVRLHKVGVIRRHTNTLKPYLKEDNMISYKHINVGKKIFIQQDNARSHISKDDPDFCRAASESEFDIQLTCQPPNSPDLNVLDLGFFNAIQSLQQKEPVKSIDELVSAVQKAFDEFSTVQSNKIFSTLQSCMIEIMKINGSNKYKIPHMKKDMLYKQGGIPVQMSCDSSLVQEVTEYLQNYDS